MILSIMINRVDLFTLDNGAVLRSFPIEAQQKKINTAILFLIIPEMIWRDTDVRMIWKTLLLIFFMNVFPPNKWGMY